MLLLYFDLLFAQGSVSRRTHTYDEDRQRRGAHTHAQTHKLVCHLGVVLVVVMVIQGVAFVMLAAD